MQMKYVGGGTFIQGVPARDLTEEEGRKFSALIREQQQITGLEIYKPVRRQEKPATDANSNKSDGKDGE